MSRVRTRAHLAVAVAICAAATALAVVQKDFGAAAAQPPGAAAVVDSVIVVDTGRQGGPLRKAGLGTLFGVASVPDTPADLAAGTQLYLSQHQSADGDASYPTSTEAVVGKMRAAGMKMIGRYNDLMGGWPYQWKGTADWMSKVDSATRSIQRYKDVLLAVAPFNEPDNKLQGGFAQDASVPGATYDEKFRWLWTQTFRRIRALDPSVPIMGPNFEHYRPWEAGQQDRMRLFWLTPSPRTPCPTSSGGTASAPAPVTCRRR